MQNHQHSQEAMVEVLLDGESLTPELLVRLGKEAGSVAKVDLTAEAWNRVKRARALVDQIIDEGQVCYGITTGFGNFANVVIPHDQICLLQENLIRSHAAGVGAPLSVELTRMLLALRINVLAKGHSGIRPETLSTLIECLNKSCLSYIPQQGTVGASGDLAPLSHLALGIMGEGQMWDPTHHEYRPAAQVLEAHHILPIKLTAKEGLALINGTQFITALTAEALIRAENLIAQGDVVAALTLEALRGNYTVFDRCIHAVRPHQGQKLVAARLWHLLNDLHSETEHRPSQIYNKNDHGVQDSYTLRCIPQVHGVVHDMLAWVRTILTTEMNSATDNPLVFGSVDGEHDGYVISGGNFHGEYPAKAADTLAIAIAELGNMSERRIDRLLSPSLSGPNVAAPKDARLPAFLVKNGGLNSGFMLAHCTAAALASENKTLAHPASVDTITTSAAQEDHVSMGGFAARKAIQAVENVERIVAIELLCACQGLDFLAPLHSTPALVKAYELVRSVAAHWGADRYMAPDIDAAAALLKANKVWDAVAPFLPDKLQRHH